MLKRILEKNLAILFFQPFFERLHWIALKGMNYGSANSPEDSGEVNVLKLLTEKDQDELIIFDVGANRGQYLDMLTRELDGLKKNIYAFEPDPGSFKLLKAKYDNVDDVNLFQIGLGSSKSKAILYQTDEASVQSSFLQIKDVPNKPVEVDVTTLDDFCSEQAIDAIDFIKVDIEGFEYEFLTGSLKMINNSKIKFLQLEHGGINSIVAGNSLYKYSEILSNYDCYHIKQNGIRALKYEPRFEIFYNSNYLFVLK